MSESIEKEIIKETVKSFSEKVEEMVYMLDIPYFEAISKLMEDGGFEPEFVAKLVSAEIKVKMAAELEQLSILKKSENLF